MRKDGIIHVLHEQSESYRKAHHAEMKRTTELCNALVTIYSIAKDKMWYPSTYDLRGEDGRTDQEKRWSDVQHDRDSMVATDK